MQLHEEPTNTTESESGRPPDRKVNPELVGDPYAMTVTLERDISVQVATRSIEAAQKFTPNPAHQAVQLSFETL